MSPDPSPSPASALSVTLPADPASPAAARRFLSTHNAELHPDSTYDALVAVSELVTNSVRHGQAPITVRVSLDAAEIVIAVHDTGASLPPAQPDATPHAAPGGRGLLILAAVSASWGVDVDAKPPGKTVWVRFPSASSATPVTP